MAFKNLIADRVFFSILWGKKKKNAGLLPPSPRVCCPDLVLLAELDRAPDVAKPHWQKSITQFRTKDKKLMKVQARKWGVGPPSVYPHWTP